MKETLEEEEATESGVTLPIASFAHDITALVLHTLSYFQKDSLPVTKGFEIFICKKKDEHVEKSEGNSS